MCIYIYNPNAILPYSNVHLRQGDSRAQIKITAPLYLDPKENDKDRREAKGHRCCLGYRIDSIHCHAIAIWHKDDFKKGMNSSYSSNRPGPFCPILHIVLVFIHTS